MKLSTIFLSLLALVPLSGAVSSPLRRRHKKDGKSSDKPDKKTFVGSFVTLSHVLEDKPDLDPQVFAECFINAFNKVFKGSGFTLEDGFVAKEFKIPEDDDGNSDGGDGSSLTKNRWGNIGQNVYVSWWEGRCGACYTDRWWEDDTWNLEQEDSSWYLNAIRRLASTSAVKHKVFEATLLNRLIATGDESVKELRHVSVEFTYATSAMEAVQAASPAVQGAGTLRLHLDIDHVRGSAFNQAEIDITADIIGDSYNLIHSGTGHKITNVHLVRRLDFPEVPGLSGPDDYYNRIWWLEADYECDDCNLLPPVSVDYLDGLHKAFEDLVCVKLQASGLPAYLHARDCDITFELGEMDDLASLMEG